jgi:hypothetical protein
VRQPSFRDFTETSVDSGSLIVSWFLTVFAGCKTHKECRHYQLFDFDQGKNLHLGTENSTTIKINPSKNFTQKELKFFLEHNSCLIRDELDVF